MASVKHTGEKIAIYFIAGLLPTEAEYAKAEALEIDGVKNLRVVFRNAQIAEQDSVSEIEKAAFYTGTIPTPYKQYLSHITNGKNMVVGELTDITTGKSVSAPKARKSGIQSGDE